MTWYRMRITTNSHETSNTTSGKILLEDKTMIRVQGYNANWIARSLYDELIKRLTPGFKLDQLSDYKYQQRIPMENGTDKIIDVELICNNAERRYIVGNTFNDIYRREITDSLQLPPEPKPTKKPRLTR